jgi:folate-binding protein YgfZ
VTDFLAVQPPAQYAALAKGAGLIDVCDRTRLVLRGADRAKFLHNLCTNEVRRLAPGSGCEAFLTNVQGKVLGHILVFCEPDCLVIDTVAGQAATIAAHLDRYLIREDVQVADASAERAEWLLAGNASPDLLARLGVIAPAGRLDHAPASVGGVPVSVRRVDMAGPMGFLIDSPRDQAAALADALVAAGAVSCDPASAESARIEAGWPEFGRDISDDNLPQEVARDDRAISFTKGCYLGQETVARIDALGHVNKTLVGVTFPSDSKPTVGEELSAEGKAAGRVTSVAFSPRLRAPLAMAYVRRGSNAPGTELACAVGSATVVRLPLQPPSRSST